MKTAKTLEAAIKNGAFMVFHDDWKGIGGLPHESVGKALCLAISDSWNDRVEDEIGNGFLCVPVNRISEVAKTENCETVAAYTMLIKSNTAARKTYIKGNPLLGKALSALSSQRIAERTASNETNNKDATSDVR